MRAATAAVVTIAVTFAIGGMIAFCKADGPLAKATAGPAERRVDAEACALPDDSTQPQASAPIKRWGDPEPQAVPPESPIAAELAEIRARVGSAVPQDWRIFGVTDVDEEAGFEKSVEALEAEAVPAVAPSHEAGDPVPPVLADSQVDEGQGIPFKPSPFQPHHGEWEMGPPPGLFLPPAADALPFESPEALSDLTKLLSATARDLERMAHVREEQRLYEEADRIRRLAMRLRRESRRLLPEPTPNPAYGAPAAARR